MKRVLIGVLIGTGLGALLAGCSAGGSGGPAAVLEGVGGAQNGGGSGGSSAGTDGSSGASGEGLPNLAAVCEQSEVGFAGLRRLTRRELEATLRDVFPSLGATWSSTLSPDTISSAGFDNDARMLLVSKQTALEVAETAELVAEAVVGSLAQVLPCAASTPDRSCAEQLLGAQGRRLFRRPLSDAQRSTFLGFFDTALSATGDFGQSIGWLVRALVESPDFLYRREVGTAEGGVVRLDQYEIAAELAYTFSGRPPSDELLDRAERGELATTEVLVETARSLLMGSGREVVRHFFDSYVGNTRITTIAKAGVPGFAERRAEMLEETRRFIEEVVFTQGGGARELLTADFTMPSQALATFYNSTASGAAPAFPAPATDYASVQRPEGYGIGLLAQGSVLATLAQPDGSSPTKRGLWIHENLLCNVVPMVPPNIPELGEPEPGRRTTRQRYAEDHAKGGCQACHSRWDPIGFAFEHFDEAGRYRADEGGLPIDTASYVPEQGVPFTRVPDVEKRLFDFADQEDLMTQLVEQPIVHQCISGYLATFVFGEPLSCVAETRRGEFITGDIGFIEYLASMAGEPHFTERRVEAPAP